MPLNVADVTPPDVQSPLKLVNSRLLSPWSPFCSAGSVLLVVVAWTWSVLATPVVVNLIALIFPVFQVIVATPLVVPPAHDKLPAPLAATLPLFSFASDPWQLLNLPVNVYFVGL